MSDEPQNTGSSGDLNNVIPRNPDGTFPPGVSGNPKGKPLGAISIIAKVKKKFADNPQYFDEWIEKFIEDPAQRRAIMEQIDGKPIQPLSGADGGAFVVELVSYVKDQNPSQLPPTN